ncbi:C-C motif chemokine 3-like [Octodon degus]|uniref:C-C motif chemokine n=1 Tax=Octodon degus TaxID=10160 RepID=A0A6P3FMR0_OCTDE|nr:C-C motif chemokine 3-like [Octodon degus]
MEVPAAGLTILILMETLLSQTCWASLGANTPTACCFFFITRKIPRKFVVDYYETSSQCPKAAVIFQTKRGREVCADLRDPWVQEYISDLELNS